MSFGLASNLEGAQARTCGEGIHVLIGDLVGAALTFKLGAKIITGLRPASGVWRLGWSARGFEIETKLGANLARNFPVIDKFVRGTITSIKSIDLTAKSYQSVGALRSTITKYADEVARFTTKSGFTRDGNAIRITEGMVRSKELLVAIEPGAASIAQRQLLADLVRNGHNGVKIVVRAVR
jgi:hypothetical protein